MTITLTGASASSIAIPLNSKFQRILNGTWLAIFYNEDVVDEIQMSIASITDESAASGLLQGFDTADMGDVDQDAAMYKLMTDAGAPANLSPANIAAFFANSTIAQQEAWSEIYRDTVLRPMEAAGIQAVEQSIGGAQTPPSFFTFLASQDNFTRNADGTWTVAAAA